eukprot:5804518-Pyramimonas_sp.AAC.1
MIVPNLGLSRFTRMRPEEVASSYPLGRVAERKPPFHADPSLRMVRPASIVVCMRSGWQDRGSLSLW